MLVLGWEKGELGESWIGNAFSLSQAWTRAGLLARLLTSGTKPGKGWDLVPT